MSSRQVLDRAITLAQIDALDIGAFVDAVRGELAPGHALADLEATDDRLRDAIDAIDGFAAKAMKVRLEHVDAATHALPPPFRRVIATTIASYAKDTGILHERVAATAARLDPRGAGAVADAVVDAARAVLDQRARLIDGVLRLARDLAAAALPDVAKAARDRHRDDAERMKWSAARRDLEVIVDRPGFIATGRFADRVKVLEPLLDEPEAEPELTREQLIELD
jgi:hypothetical protein